MVGGLLRADQPTASMAHPPHRSAPAIGCRAWVVRRRRAARRRRARIPLDDIGCGSRRRVGPVGSTPTVRTPGSRCSSTPCPAPLVPPPACPDRQSAGALFAWGHRFPVAAPQPGAGARAAGGAAHLGVARRSRVEADPADGAARCAGGSTRSARPVNAKHSAGAPPSRIEALPIRGGSTVPARITACRSPPTSHILELGHARSSR